MKENLLTKLLFDPLVKQLTEESKRKVKVLSTLLLLLIIIVLIFLVIPELAGVTSFGSMQNSIIVLILLLVSYIITRFGKADFVTIFNTISFSVFIFYLARNDLNLLAFLVLPLIFASIFLSLKYLRRTFIVIAITTILYPIVVEDFVINEIIYGFFLYLVIVEILLYLASWNRNKLEKAHFTTVLDREKFLNSIVNNAAEAIVTTDSEGRIIFWNPAAEEMFGYNQSEILKKDLAVIIPDEFKNESQKVLKRLSEEIPSTTTQEGYGMEGKSKDGKRISINISVASWYIKDNAYYTAIIWDVTRNRQVEESFKKKKEEAEVLASKFKVQLDKTENQNELLEGTKKAMLNLLEDIEADKAVMEEEKAKSESILLAIGDGLVVTGRDNKIVLINNAFQRMLGWKRKEVIGKKYTDVIPMENEKGRRIPAEQRTKHLVMFEGKSITQTDDSFFTTISASKPFYYVKKDESRFPVNVTRTPIVMNRKSIGNVEVFRDITLEREIDVAKTEFVSIASHQLRTPLSTIAWYTEMLQGQDTGKLNTEQSSYLKEIYTGTKRMIKLVNALLNVSRIEMGTFMVEPILSDIIEVARKAIREFSHEVERKNLNLKKKFNKAIPKIKIDPKLLHIVFQNLVSNAVKYTPKGGEITISIEIGNGKNGTVTEQQKNKNILIKVADTGYGIPKNQQAKIFTKLFRGDNIKQKDPDGTGLGLYIVKSIVDSAEGKIWFESEEDKGTTFFVTIPMTGMKRQEGSKSLT